MREKRCEKKERKKEREKRSEKGFLLQSVKEKYKKIFFFHIKREVKTHRENLEQKAMFSGYWKAFKK